ncbi:hypothetical protein MTO96_017115, partial [Rhipicephalus appendiculatus]
MAEVNGLFVNALFNAGTGLLRLGSTTGMKTRAATAARFKPVSHVIFDMDGLLLGAERLVRHLHAHGIPIAIATSSKPASFVLKMARHRELLALFHHVVCSGGDPE